MKNTIKNFALLDKIQAMQLKISKCFESKNIIYCNSIFVQLPTIQFKIAELNIISGLKREDTITMTFKENRDYTATLFVIETTRKINTNEAEKLKKLFTKTYHITKIVYTENEATAQAKEFENDMEFLEDIVKEEREKVEIDEIIDKNTIEDINKNSLETIETLINNREEKEEKREWVKVESEEIEIDYENNKITVINNPLINNNNE